jgi:hypothetical protein
MPGAGGTRVQPADFREQATLAYENPKAAIERVGGMRVRTRNCGDTLPIVCGSRPPR